MALVSAKEMLEKARDGKYAVGQFNINNLEWTKSILQTAQELQSPVILGVSEGAGKYMTGFKTVAAMVSAMNFVQLGVNGNSLGNEFYANVYLPTLNVTSDNVMGIISGTHWDMSAYNY